MARPEQRQVDFYPRRPVDGLSKWVLFKAIEQDNTSMQRFVEGDSVRVDIPNPDDPDFDGFHGREGQVTEVLRDAAGEETGDERDAVVYRVRFEDGDEMDFRWRDLRPVRR